MPAWPREWARLAPSFFPIGCLQLQSIVEGREIASSHSPCSTAMEKRMNDSIQGWTIRPFPGLMNLCSYCYLPLLPQLACSILAIWEQPYSGALRSVHVTYPSPCHRRTQRWDFHYPLHGHALFSFEFVRRQMREPPQNFAVYCGWCLHFSFPQTGTRSAVIVTH